MNNTNYGDIVNGFAAHKKNKESIDWRLGYTPVLHELGNVMGQKIFDLGCGPANFSAGLTQLGAHVIGVDSDSTVIAEARVVDPLGDYRVSQGCLVDECAGVKIDIIIATFSLCAMADCELHPVLHDLRRMLKTGGKFIILEPNQEKSNGVKYADIHYHYKEGVKTGDLVDVTLGDQPIPPDIYRTHADYRELLEEAGFIIDAMTEPVPDRAEEGERELELKYPPFLLITCH